MAIVTGAYLAPTISAGFGSDDAGMAQAHGFAGYEKLSHWRAFWEIGRQLAAENGGWFPFAGVQVAFWLLEPSAPLARGAQLLVVVADVALFTLLIARLSASLRCAAVAGFATLCAIQLRVHNDPILDGTLQIPSIFCLTLLALLAFVRWCECGRKRFLVGAIFLESLACGASEIGCASAVLFAVLAATLRGRARAGWLFPAVPFVLLVAAAIARAPGPASLDWLVHPTVADVRRAGVDVLGSIPTSYRAAGLLVRDGATFFDVDNRFEAIPRVPAWEAALAFVAFLCVAWAVSSGTRLPIARERIAAIAGIGLTAIVIAAAIHAAHVAPAGIVLGEADPATFYAAFGIGALLSIAIVTADAAAMRTQFSAFPLAAALALALILYGNMRANARVIELAQNRHETWRLIEAAGRARLFDRLDAASIIAYDGAAALPADRTSGFRNLRYLLYQATHRRYDVADVRDLAPGGRLCRERSDRRACVPKRSVWIVSRQHADLFAGGLAVGAWATTSDGNVLVDRILGYKRFASPQLARATFDALAQRGDDVRVLHGSVDGNVLAVDVRRRCSPVTLARAFTKDAPALTYGAGFEPPDFFKRYHFATPLKLETTFDGAQTWRYGGTQATLHVAPSSCRESLRLTGSLIAAGAAEVVVSAGKQRLALAASLAPVDIDFPFRAASTHAIDIAIRVRGPSAADEPGPPFDRRRFPPAYFILANAKVSFDARR
ncbi:MAG: hypothetical protein NVSMB19_17040 [Vulcanimicrobiaceae bacterium]